MTINNYTDFDIEKIYDFCTERNCVYAIFGKEIGESGTPHLQGFLHLKKRMKMGMVKKKISILGHYEMARGTDDENKDYCAKDGDILIEVGTPAPKAGTNQSYLNAFELAGRVAAGESIYELISNNDDYLFSYMKHSRSIENLVEERRNENGKAAFVAKYSVDLNLYDWQKDLYHMLTTEEPHDRFIYWYVDYVGGAGKSTFVNYFLSRHDDAVCFFGGKISDLSYAYNYEKVVFFDLARSGASDYLFGFIEQVKNGRVFSSK